MDQARFLLFLGENPALSTAVKAGLYKRKYLPAIHAIYSVVIEIQKAYKYMF